MGPWPARSDGRWRRNLSLSKQAPGNSFSDLNSMVAALFSPNLFQANYNYVVSYLLHSILTFPRIKYVCMY